MIEPVARIRIEMQEIQPKIWRRVDVPLSTTLMALHDIIQLVFDWQEAHLFEFEIGDKVYGEPSPDDPYEDRKVYQAKSLRLGTLLDRGVERLLYVYDFGDNWRHDVTIEEVFEGAADVDYPVFVNGARRAPPEDVGGTTGFMEFLEAILDPSHPEHRGMRDWYGGPFDPHDINERHILRVLSMWADRRRGPLMSHRKGNRPSSS